MFCLLIKNWYFNFGWFLEIYFLSIENNKYRKIELDYELWLCFVKVYYLIFIKKKIYVCIVVGNFFFLVLNIFVLYVYGNKILC